MTPKKIALINAILFFVFWLLVLYAGADHPPPPGFIALIVLDAFAALLVYLRAPTYIHWAKTRKKNRLLYVLRDGLAAGVAFALLAVLFSGGSGEPGVPPPGAMEYAIWFIVLGVVGAANATAIYFINALVAGKLKRE